MKKDLKIAVVQTSVPMNYVEGEKQVARLVDEAAKKGVDIVGLPEDCLSTTEEAQDGYNAEEFLSIVARTNNVYLFGANAVMEKGKLFDRGFLFDRHGDLIGKQDKIVLTPINEREGFAAGKYLNVFDTEFGKLAILVCKDSFHRYSAWFFDLYKKAGVDVVLIPSYSLNVSPRSIALWLDSLKALSRWFDIYIAASGTIGKGIYEFESFGNALIMCPNRGVLKQGSYNKQEILTTTLDVKNLEEIRNTFGSLWQPKDVPKVKVKF